MCNDCGPDPSPHQHNIGDTLNCDSSVFVLAELQEVLSRCKVNKQPGRDCIVAELYKWLNAENNIFLLDILNQWWTSATNRNYSPRHLTGASGSNL